MFAHSRLASFPENADAYTRKGIDLSDNFIKEIPEIGAPFSQLKHLDLSKNQITALPKNWSRFPVLQSLQINQNGLKTIPKDTQLPSTLTELNIAANQLKTLPKSIETANIQTLNIAWNKLSDIPESLTKLKELKLLILDSNNINELPESISNLQKLETLSLSNNNLIYLPENLVNMPQLKNLNLSENKLRQFPEDFHKLKLERLTIRDNPLRSLHGLSKEQMFTFRWSIPKDYLDTVGKRHLTECYKHDRCDHVYDYYKDSIPTLIRKVSEGDQNEHIIRRICWESNTIHANMISSIPIDPINTIGVTLIKECTSKIGQEITASGKKRKILL